MTIAGGVRGLFGLAGAAGAAGPSGGLMYPIAAGVPWIGGNPVLYYRAGAGTLGVVASAFTANQVFFVPFMVGRNAVVDRIATEVIIAVAASNVRVGLYASTANYGPGARLADSGALSAAAIGIKEVAVNIALTAGLWYWAAYSCDTAGISVPAIQNAANQTPNTPMAGKPSGQFNSTMAGALLRTATFALPDPAAPNTEHTGNSPIPGVFFRFSA